MLSRDQYLSLVVTSCINFFCATCISLQAPFYPLEAEKKGATATEYGLVFGCFELVGFLTSSLIGTIVGKVGAKFVLSVGLIISSISTVLFGQLDRISDHFLFITLSFVIRIIEAIGCSAANVSSFSIMGMMFRDNIASVFATLELFFGIGYMVGPFLGGILFSVGGFQLPFAVIGLLSAVVACLLYIYVPDIKNETYEDTEFGLSKVYKTPEIMISAFGLCTFTMSSGFYNATLEPHIRQFHLTPFLTGVVFIVTGATYAVVTPVFGQLMDVYIKPKPMLFLGCVLSITSFAIVGPLPFLPIPKSLTICIIALFLEGIALAAGILAEFTYIFRVAIENGFPENFATYGLLSGLCGSSYALGAFIGPSVAGILYDLVGFSNATIFVILIHLVLIFLEIICLIIKVKKRKIKINDDASVEFVEADLPTSSSEMSKNEPFLYINSNYGAI